MAKFNVIQKQRRAIISQRKRVIEGDPVTRKLKSKSRQLVSVSGKRKRKLLRQQRRNQKEAIEKGLIDLQDEKMAIDDGEEPIYVKEKTHAKFPLKKGLKIKMVKRKGKKQTKSKPELSVDAMLE